MKFVCLNDVHLSHRGPQSRTDDWQEAIFGKLEQVSKVAVKVKAKAVCIAGDVFHHKSRIAYGTVLRLMMWAFALRRLGIDVLTIPGNHDEVHNRLDSIDSQPLGLLFASGAFTDVSYKPVIYTVDDEQGREIHEQRVTILGVPFPDAENLDNFKRAAEMRGEHAGRSLLMAHCFATPQGGTYFSQPIHAYALFNDLPFDVFHFGHDHSDHGVAQMGDKFFINIGSISRGSLALDDLKREPKIALVEFGETVTVKQIKLRVSPVGEIFDLALKAQKDRERGEVEAFVGQLREDLATAGPISFKDRLGKMELTDTVRARALTYIDAAEQSLQEM